MTDEMVAITAFREIHTLAAKGGIKGITCKLPVESMNYLINMKRDEIALIEKEDKVSIRLTADTKMFPGQYTMTVDKIEEEKTAAKEEKTERKTERRGEHKAEYKTGRPAEHKPEQRAEQTPEHKEHTPEHKLESGKQPKRWPRSRGRRRPKYGPKTGPAAETAGAPAVEPMQAEVGNEEASVKPFPVQHALTVDKIQEEKAKAGSEHEAEHDRLHLADHTSEPGAATERRPKRSRPWGKRRPKYGSKSGPSKETAGSDAEETPKTAAGSQNEGSSQD